MTKKDAEETATTLGTTLKINFWCMNPAVCFGDIKDDIRSVVLTSGTLSPMASFGSELAVDFKQTFEGAHVVDDKQIFAVSVGFGPTGVSLNGNYKSSGASEGYSSTLVVIYENYRFVFPSQGPSLTRTKWVD